MKFLVDAQLPQRLAQLLQTLGQNALHTLSLPAANRTTDTEIIRIADTEDRAVITKDSDFVNSFLVSNRPSRLLLVSTGNITNDELLQVFTTNLTSIVTAYQTAHFLELDRTGVAIRG
jgi:predicted nuclease of predicted toxin-antitoxin system